MSGATTEVEVTGGEAHDEINVGTGDGSDTITTNVAVTGTALFDVDGGDSIDTLDYTGTAGADQISVVANGAKLRTGGPASAPLDTIVENIRVQGLGGDDAINAIGNTVSSLLTFDGGAGADNVRGGVGSDVLLGGSGNDLVDGNSSADVAEMGSGNDRFQWDPGDGSDTVDGQGGSDAVDFNGSNIGEVLELSEYFGRALFTRNIANITMSADVEALRRALVRRRRHDDRRRHVRHRRPDRRRRPQRQRGRRRRGGRHRHRQRHGRRRRGARLPLRRSGPRHRPGSHDARHRQRGRRSTRCASRPSPATTRSRSRRT